MRVTHGYTHCSHVTARYSHVTLWKTFSLPRHSPPPSAWLSKQSITATRPVAICRAASSSAGCCGFARSTLKRGSKNNSVRPKIRLPRKGHTCRATAVAQLRRSRSQLGARRISGLASWSISPQTDAALAFSLAVSQWDTLACCSVRVGHFTCEYQTRIRAGLSLSRPVSIMDTATRVTCP